MKTLGLLLLLGALTTAAAAQSTSCASADPDRCSAHPGLVIPPAVPPHPPVAHNPLYPPPGVSPNHNSCVPLFTPIPGPGSVVPGDICQRNDNDSAGPIPLGFTFEIFGQQVRNVYLNTNGNLTFGAPLSLGTPIAFPAAGLPPMIAPFWADVDTRAPLNQSPDTYVAGTGTIWTRADLVSGGWVATWDHVGYNRQHSDKLNTFQVVLTNGQNPLLPVVPGTNRRFNVAFFYNDMNWTTGDTSGGVNGFGGTGALVGASLNGSGCAVPTDCSATVGQFTNGGSSLAGGGVDWLSWRAVYLDVSVSPPVVQVDVPIPDPIGVIAVSPIPNAGLITSSGDVGLLDPTLILLMEKGTGPVFTIPYDPSLMGIKFYVQIATVDPVMFPNDPIKMTPGMIVEFGSGWIPYYFDINSAAEIYAIGAPRLGSSFMLHREIPGL